MRVARQHQINWNYTGKPDALFGTGATAVERGVVWLFGLLGTGLLIWLAWNRSVPWAWWQYALAILMALDVLGGVVANALNSCKRFYHAPLHSDEKGLTALAKKPWFFIPVHVHPLVAGLLFGSVNWTYGLFWYAAMLLSAVVVLRIPLYLQRSVALGLIMMAILVNYYGIMPVLGFEWLVPALFLKIIYGHIVREEPYCPTQVSQSSSQ